MKIEEAIQTTFKDERFKAMINLKYTANWMNTHQNKGLEEFGLTIPQYNILRILRGSKGMSLSVNTIRDRMVEKSPNTTRLMDKLIDKELIERTRCEKDRRVVYVMITEKGLDLLNEITIKLGDSSDFMRNITLEEASLMNELLDKIRS
ncbi:MarR family transcriptional regulator [Wandonia haliotis]|uniref:MarR family transcriptional regulator n=1 Tax=Wandonia haliotis TaxID=574963 RepID=A0ABP3Y453_9FLAO